MLRWSSKVPMLMLSMTATHETTMLLLSTSHSGSWALEVQYPWTQWHSPSVTRTAFRSWCSIFLSLETSQKLYVETKLVHLVIELEGSANTYGTYFWCISWLHSFHGTCMFRKKV